MSKENINEDAFAVLINIIDNKIAPIIYQMSQFDKNTVEKVINSKEEIFGDIKKNPNILLNPNANIPADIFKRMWFGNILNAMIDCVDNVNLQRIYRRIRNIYTEFNYYDNEMIDYEAEGLYNNWNESSFTAFMIFSILSIRGNGFEVFDESNIEEAKISSFIYDTLENELNKISELINNI